MKLNIHLYARPPKKPFALEVCQHQTKSTEYFAVKYGNHRAFSSTGPGPHPGLLNQKLQAGCQGTGIGEPPSGDSEVPASASPGRRGRPTPSPRVRPCPSTPLPPVRVAGPAAKLGTAAQELGDGPAAPTALKKCRCLTSPEIK